MTANEVKAKFGNNCKLASINGYNVEKEGEEIVGLEVIFKNVTGKLVKNRPYILYVEEDINDFEIENKTIDPKETTYTPVNEDEDDLPTSMTGCMKAGTLVPAKSLFLSGNQFWYSTGKTKMKAFRAYFTFEENLSSVASSRIKFTLSDGDTQTEIQIPELMPNDGEYYDLKGQRVETPSKGIYIKDGKKVVVK